MSPIKAVFVGCASSEQSSVAPRMCVNQSSAASCHAQGCTGPGFPLHLQLPVAYVTPKVSKGSKANKIVNPVVLLKPPQLDRHGLHRPFCSQIS